jgi:hypothetical protein
LARTALHLSFKCDLGFCHHDGSIMSPHIEVPNTDFSRRKPKLHELPLVSPNTLIWRHLRVVI